jgi:hypothetical protein
VIARRRATKIVRGFRPETGRIRLTITKSAAGEHDHTVNVHRVTGRRPLTTAGSPSRLLDSVRAVVQM